MGHIIKFIVSIVFVSFIAAFYALLNIDLNDYKQQIETAAADATGRQLSLEGDVSIAWSLIPTLTVKQARFANAKWGTAPDMVSFGEFEVRLALYPLIKRKVEVTKVMLNKPQILIETNAKGVGNWVFEQQAKPAETEIESASPIQSVIVNELDIEQAQIHYIDGVTGEKKQFEIDTLTIDVANAVDPIDLLLKAVIDEIPLSAEGQLGGLDALIGNTKTVLDMALLVDGVAITLNGAIARPHEGKGVSLDLNLNADDAALSRLSGNELPAFGDLVLSGRVANDVKTDVLDLDLSAVVDGLTLLMKGQIAEPQEVKGLALNIDLETDAQTLSALTDSELPPLGTIKLVGVLSGGDNNYGLTDFVLKAGKTDLAGEVTVSLAGDKPDIDAVLVSEFIDLMVLESAETEKEEAPAVASERLFSDVPLDLAGLKQVNMMVSLNAKAIDTNTMRLKKLTLGLDLNEGHLKVAPLKVGLAGSELNGDLDLNTQKEIPTLKTKVQINGFKLAQVAALKDTISGGNTDVFLQFNARGQSVSQLMAGMNGKAIVKVGESQVADGTLNLLGADFIGELASMLNPFSEKQKGTRLSCAVVNFNIVDGLANADKGIAVQTDKLNIVGSGTINLKNEKIKIRIKPEARTGLGVNMSQLASLVRVGGTLANPAAKVDAAAVLATGASGAAAVATGGLSVLAQGVVNRTTADDNPCETALGNQ